MKKKDQKSKNANPGHNGSRPSEKESKTKRGGLHPTRNDLPEKVRAEVCEMLNETLANTLDLYTQTKQAHWNVKGVHFYQLHLLFDEIASELSDYVDLFAERITSLGGTAFGTVRMAARATALPEYPTNISEGMDHVVALAERMAMCGHLVREGIDDSDEIGDMDTADIYTEVSRDIDKRLWFLEAHLQARSAEREAQHGALAGSARN